MKKAYQIKIYTLAVDYMTVVTDEKEANEIAYTLMKSNALDEQDGLKIEVKLVDTCSECGNEVGAENLSIFEGDPVCQDCEDALRKEELE